MNYNPPENLRKIQKIKYKAALIPILLVIISFVINIVFQVIFVKYIALLGLLFYIITLLRYRVKNAHPPEELDHIILSPIHGKVIKIGDNSILIKKGVFSAADIRSSQSKFKINNKNIIWFERDAKLDGKLIGFVAESTLCNCEIPDDYRIVTKKKDKVEAGNTILAKLEDNRE